jgi:SRSO17 transposase
VIEPAAWVLDDTGIPKDGKRSPGVKRQYSGTLGKIGSCQIAVSLHAVSARGTVPLGFSLYLPEDWCEDPERRKRAKIPADVEFQTKPALGAELVARAGGWKIRRAPVLGDQAYGNDAKLRTRLHEDGIDYVLSVSAESDVFAPETVFAVPERKPGSRGPTPSRPRPDREPESIGSLVGGLGAEAWQTVAFRDIDGSQLVSRFAFVRVIAANPIKRDQQAPREEWLIAELEFPRFCGVPSICGESAVEGWDTDAEDEACLSGAVPAGGAGAGPTWPHDPRCSGVAGRVAAVAAQLDASGRP